jgi:hypothetical protein
VYHGRQSLGDRLYQKTMLKSVDGAVEIGQNLAMISMPASTTFGRVF